MINFRPYRKKKSYTLAIIIILLAAFVSFYSFRSPSRIRSVLTSAIYPFQWVTVSAWKMASSVPVSIINLRNLSKENAELKGELSRLKPRLIVMEGQAGENNRLRSVLGFRNSGGYGFKLLAAQVIGRSPTPWFSILKIDQGSRAGIKVGRPVIVKEGLAGSVIEVSVFSSKIMLLTDAESSVAAVDSRSRDFGVVQGASRNKLYMKYVSAGGDIKEGDKIETSQISKIYPPGLLIGTVGSASKREHDLFYQIQIKPAVDFSKLEEVFVII